MLEGRATHVITGIDYGGSAAFTIVGKMDEYMKDDIHEKRIKEQLKVRGIQDYAIPGERGSSTF